MSFHAGTDPLGARKGKSKPGSRKGLRPPKSQGKQREGQGSRGRRNSVESRPRKGGDQAGTRYGKLRRKRGHPVKDGLVRLVVYCVLCSAERRSSASFCRILAFSPLRNLPSTARASTLY